MCRRNIHVLLHQNTVNREAKQANLYVTCKTNLLLSGDVMSTQTVICFPLQQKHILWRHAETKLYRNHRKHVAIRIIGTPVGTSFTNSTHVKPVTVAVRLWKKKVTMGNREWLTRHFCWICLSYTVTAWWQYQHGLCGSALDYDTLQSGRWTLTLLWNKLLFPSERNGDEGVPCIRRI